MSILAYPANSPYASTPQYSTYIGRWVFRPVNPDSGDQQYTLSARHQYRPDKLSFELYATPNYWWVFCVRNPQLRADPVWNFISGLTIIVPSAQYLRSALGA